MLHEILFRMANIANKKYIYVGTTSCSNNMLSDVSKNALMYVCESEVNFFTICAIIKISLFPIAKEVVMFVHLSFIYGLYCICMSFIFQCKTSRHRDAGNRLSFNGGWRGGRVS